MAYSLEGQRDRMVSALEVAAQLNPSFSQAHSYLGSYLALAGRPDDAIPKLQKAMRLSPQDPWTWRHLQGMALAHLVAERYEEAIHWAEWSLQRKPDWYISYLILAGAYVFLSRPSEARAAVEEVLRLQPGLSVSGFKLFLSAADPAVFDRLMQGLRKAGLPE
jgi:tetratricopeptide (TPR) repeat protein